MTQHWPDLTRPRLTRGGVAGIIALAVLLIFWPRAAALLLLFFGPGAWLTFSKAFAPRSFGERLWLGAALSPVIVIAQFYALRLVGLQFDAATIAIVVLNLPAVWLIARAIPTAAPPEPSHLVIGALVLLVPLACLAPQLLDAPARALSGHAWWHADAAHFIANGQLVVEDADLAGVRLGYAWTGHAYQAVLSRLLDSSPLSSFIWSNLICLAVVYVFVARTTGALGGAWTTRLATVAWLSFGVNFVGYVVWKSLNIGLVWNVLPGDAFLGDLLPLGGDYRFTPWLLYFFFFHQIVLALAMFAAAMYLLVARSGERVARADVVVLSLLGAGVAAIYPVLSPAFWSIVLAAMAGTWLRGRAAEGTSPWPRIRALALVLLVAVVVTGVCVSYTARDRVAGTMALQAPHALLRHALVSLIVLAPLLAGASVVLKRFLRARIAETITLLLGGLASLGVYVLFSLPGGGLEYKFIFTAALCLAPFPALALEPLLNRLGRRGSEFAVVVLTLVLAAPAAHKLMTDSWSRFWIPSLDFGTAPRPALDVSAFQVRLRDDEPAAQLVDAVRTETPANTVLVARAPELHLPTLTQRPFYAAPAQDKGSYRGINVAMDQVLLDIRGYDPQLLAERQATIESLFTGADDASRATAFEKIAKLGRPVAIVLGDADSALAGWVQRRGGENIHTDERSAVWLLRSPVNGSTTATMPLRTP
jgi:hypothetical protein